jgi:uncharacterized DUF497 family protein
MGFKVDSSKTEVNKNKHRIDSVGVRALWEDPDFVEIPTISKDEARFLVAGPGASPTGAHESESSPCVVFAIMSDAQPRIAQDAKRQAPVNLYQASKQGDNYVDP